jgi:hypothetical protein
MATRDVFIWMLAQFLVCFSSVSTLKSGSCPFCNSINLTFAEQLKINDLVVIATLTDVPRVPGKPGEPPRYQFEVNRVIKGNLFITLESKFWAGMKAEPAVGQQFLVWGIGPPLVDWDEPILNHPRIEKYLEEIQRLPEKGPDRLAFFQDYFEDEQSVLASDAYDEFAIATYEDLMAMKSQMKREKLLEFTQRAEVDENHRRLYFTMLGVCGTKEDLPLLEQFLTSSEAVSLAGLDSLVACYLCLKGAEGLELIEKQFLDAEEIDYTKIHQVISALRFHGTEVEMVDRRKLISTVRKLLTRPRFADMVIPDLARWEDWTVMEQLVTMFKDPQSNPNWIRVPIFQFLLVCPLPEAKQHIEELSQLDPIAYQRALFLANADFDDQNDQDLDQECPEEEDDGSSKPRISGLSVFPPTSTQHRWRT